MPIRPIEIIDNPKLEKIILSVLTEFDGSGPGFAGADPETRTMFENFSKSRHCYYVIEENREILGGGGIAPLKGGHTDTCELQKMYFLKELRGKGYGQKIMDICLEKAREMKFKQCYLETLEHMTAAKQLYHKNGFEKLAGPMGSTGHFGCNNWYLKQL